MTHSSTSAAVSKRNKFSSGFKFLSILLLVLLLSGKSWGADVIPKLYLTAQNTPSGNTGWTFTNAPMNNAGTDYWKMITASAGSVVTSPTMNFSSYTGITITVVTSSFGSILPNLDYLKLEYYNGTTWSQVAFGNSTTYASAISLPYTYSSAQIRLTATNASGSAGARLTSVQISGTPGATQLALVGTPSTGTTGTLLSSFTVEARLAGGTVDNNYTSLVTLTKASGTGTISGTLSANCVAGVATFNNVAFNPANTYTITASSGTLTTATSGSIVISNPSTNVSGGDGVNWVGSNQSYSLPTNCSYPDYRVLKYRKVNTTTANTTDGRGQWVTTINAAASGADVTNTNMTGGSSNGFVFISGGGCGSIGNYGNKWNFSGVGTASLNAINGMQWTTGTGNDMGLNMSTAGKYTFVFKDAGYTSTGFYVGYTAATPVTITHNTGTQRTQNNDGTTTIAATVSGTPSATEYFYVRYKTGSGDFSTGTSTVSAAGSVVGTTATMTIPLQTDGATVYYYIFSSTMTSSALNALSEGDKSYALLNYADNAGSNYSFTALSLSPTITSVTPTAVTGITGQATATGYKGQTITIVGTNFQSNATVTINGVAATSVTYVSATQLTAVVANTGANVSTTVVVANPTPVTSANTAFNFLGYITSVAGVLTTASNWLGGTAPIANSTVTLAHNMTLGSLVIATPFTALNILTGISLTINGTAGPITVTNALTISSTGTLTFTAGGSVTAGSISNAGTISFGTGSSNANLTSTTLTNTGTISWTTLPGTLNISAGGTLTNNGTVTSSSAGNVVFAGAGTINGSNAITFNNLTINGTTTLTTVPTINGTLQLNGGNVTASPNYGAASTLFYNVSTYNRYLEWASGATANPGYPFNVTIGSTTQACAFNLQNSATTKLGGTLTIGAASGSASSLTMNESGSGTPQPLTVVGSVVVNATGTLTLGNLKDLSNVGDLYVGGSWTKNGTFTPNSRLVTFNGTSGTQTITGATTFDYLTFNNTGTSVSLTNSVTVNNTLTFTAGKVTLGANNLTVASGGAISGGSSTAYAVTASTGLLIKQGVGNSPVTFPVGYSATNYTPVTITNTTGTSDLSVLVKQSITNAVVDATKIVTLEWGVTSSAATTATITPTWVAATPINQAASFTNTGTGEIGTYTTSYTSTPVTLANTTTTATGVALQNGSNKIVVGNSGAVVFLTPPALTAAPSAIVDGVFDVTFTDNAASQAWVSAGGTAVTVGGTTLTAGYTISNGKITFTPSASVPANLLQAAGTSKAIVISKTGYTNATVAQTLSAGAINKLQVLMPGETAAPGTATGKSGSVTAQTAGAATTVTINSVDQYWNVVNSTRTIAITSSDANAALPSNADLIAGTQTYSVTFKTAGTGRTVTATDQSGSPITANIGSSTTVNVGAVNKLQLLMPGEVASPGSSTGKTSASPTAQVAGTQFTITVNAVDANWNVVTSNGNTVAITSSDANSTMPTSAALSTGTKTFNVTIKTAASFTLTATNSTNGAITANTSPSTSISAGAVNKLQLLMPGEVASPGSSIGKTAATPTAQIAGSSFNVTVNAVDVNWNVVSSNTSTIAITSSDVNAILPSSATLVSGTGTFAITCKTAGSKTVTATTTGLSTNTSVSPATTINAGALTKLQVLLPGETASAGSATGKTGTASSQIASLAFTITVNAVDDNWNVVTSANDNIHITSSDASATLPSDAILVSGTKTFSVTPITLGSSTVTATDVTNGSITANQSASITVNPTPVITVTPTSLAAFSASYGNASTAQAFTVNGSNLVADITVTAPTGYEVSQTSATTVFAATQILSQTSGSVSNVVVYVRLASTAAAGSNSGNVAMTSTSATTVNIAVSGNVNGASLIAGWDFTTTSTGGTASAGSPNTPTLFNANFGNGILYLDGTNGSSSWLQASELDAFGGTINNTGTGFSTSTSTGTSLSILGGGTSPTYTANGKSMVFKFNMSNYKDLILSYSSRYSGTSGFTTQQWDYSINGTDWTIGQTITISSSTYSTFTLNKITALDNATNAYLRLTVSGATAVSGNNRLDNIQLNATANSATIIAGGGPLTSLSTTYGTASAATSFTVAGNGLGSNTISIDALSGYEFSSGGAYSSSLSGISATGPTNINVRLAANANVGSYSGSIHCTSGVTTFDIPMTTGTVSKATPTLTVSNTPVTYDATAKSATATASGGGVVSNISTGGAASQTNAGTYTVTADIAASTNYNAATGATATNSFVINKATPSVTVTVESYTYTGSAQGPNAVTTASSGYKTYSYVGVNGTSYAASSTQPTAVGDYTVTASVATDANYNTASSSATAFSIIALTSTISSSASIGTNALLPGTDLTVQHGALLTVDNDSPTTVHSITVNPGGKLTLANTKSLTILGNLTLHSGATYGTGTFVDENATSHLTVNGTTTVEQNLATARNWYISSPVTTADRNMLPAGTLWKYNEPNTATPSGLGTALWEVMTTNESLGVMQGYIFKPTAPGLVSFTGTLNTGNKSITVNRTENTKDKRGFNLVGNPYPSYLDWMAAIDVLNTSTTNLLTSVWYRSQNAGQPTADPVVLPYYVFDTYNVTANTGTNNNGNGDVTGMIPPMQAFWVRVKASGNGSSTTGTLAVTNAMRAHESDTNPLKAPSVTSQPTLRLQVSNGLSSDETIILFNSKASDGFDAFDSPKMTNGTASIPEIYTIAGVEQLSINGLQTLSSYREMPLGFTTGQTNTFTIKAKEISNFAADTRIYLRDNLLKGEQELTNDGFYTFNSDKTSSTDRFTLIFKTPSITDGINSLEGSSFWISTNADGKILINGTANGETRVNVYNAIGQRLASKNLTSNVSVLDTRLVPGVYTITLTNAGKSATTKVIVK